MTAQPDILLLVLDTQRFDRLSCYGYQQETSPHLDEFAADATLFRHAVAAGQWTLPSHGSMFTGLYPSSHTMFHASSVLPQKFTTLAERLSSNGYFTAAYCNNPLLGIVNNGLQRGFYSFLNYGGLMTSRPNQMGPNKRWTDRYRRHFKRALAGTLNTIQDAFARSDTLLAFSFSPLMVPLWQTALRFKGNTKKTLNDAANLLIDRKGLNDDQPVFSFINLMGTHMPYHPPSRLTERFAPHLLHDKAARRYLRRFNSDVFGWLAPLASDLHPQHKATLDGMYDAEVAYQDELLGTFFKRLRASGRLENTLVMVCADHGEHLGEKQLMGHSISIYDTLVHVPLIIRDPEGNLPRGKSVDHVVSTRRIFHTALTAAGLASEPEQTLSLAQSESSDPDHSIVFSEAVTPLNALSLLQRHRPDVVERHHCEETRRAVLRERYKLIQRGEEHFELYDVFDDPEELVDLSAILPEQVEEMQEYLHTFLQHVGDATPTAEYVSHDDPQVYRRLRDLGYLE